MAVITEAIMVAITDMASAVLYQNQVTDTTEDIMAVITEAITVATEDITGTASAVLCRSLDTDTTEDITEAITVAMEAIMDMENKIL